MKAIATWEIGEDGCMIQPFTISPDYLAKRAAEQRRRESIQAGLQSLFGLPESTRVEYRPRVYRAIEKHQVVPELGALVVDVAWGDQQHRVWIDDRSRIDEDLTTLLGAEANHAMQAYKSFQQEEVSEETDAARSAAIEDTQCYRTRELELASVALIAA